MAGIYAEGSTGCFGSNGSFGADNCFGELQQRIGGDACLPSRSQCGYNNHMARSSIVGSRELKTRLGQYLNRVRRGETILVTDRHEPVAELKPLPGVADPTRATLHKLAAAGLVTLPVRSALGRFEAIRSRGSASAVVSRDRSDRG
jgi:prevent-host-death family protein